MGISCGSHRIWVRNNLVAEPFCNGAIYLSRMGWCATSTRPWNADRTKAIRTSQLWVKMRKALYEQILSELHPITDIERRRRQRTNS
jgi:hypothetical protein